MWARDAGLVGMGVVWEVLVVWTPEREVRGLKRGGRRMVGQGELVGVMMGFGGLRLNVARELNLIFGVSDESVCVFIGGCSGFLGGV